MSGILKLVEMISDHEKQAEMHDQCMRTNPMRRAYHREFRDRHLAEKRRLSLVVALHLALDSPAPR